MRHYSEDLPFYARDSRSGNKGLIVLTLALVNNSRQPDTEVRKEVSGFLEKVAIDFHSDDPNVPRELPALYESGPERNNCYIYPPRDGTIKSVEINPEVKEVSYKGRDGQNETFALRDTDYHITVKA